MSNHLAIATVTVTLGKLVSDALNTTGIDSLGHPEYGPPKEKDPNSNKATAHIYLYHVTPDPARRNDDLPSRDSSGKLVGRPRAALNLHYLLAFYGNAAKLEPERMLGAVVRDLHARPLLSRHLIDKAIASADQEVRTALQGSNLKDSVDRVRFTPAAMSMDELSKLWSVFFQTKHALSVAYDASVVLIDAEESGPAAAPVLSRGEADRGAEAIADARSPFPVLENLHIGPLGDVGQEPLPRSFPAASVGDVLIFQGKNLAGDKVRLRFTHTRYGELGHPQFLVPLEPEIAVAERTPGSIRFTIGSDHTWRIGVYTVSVIVEKDGKESAGNNLTFLLAPKVVGITPKSVTIGDSLTIQCSPAVLASQPASLLLLDQEINRIGQGADSGQLQFSIQNLPPAVDAVIRLRVDGVESIPYERIYKTVDENGNEKETPPTLRFADSQKLTLT